MKEYARQKYKWDICHWGPPICLGGTLWVPQKDFDGLYMFGGIQRGGCSVFLEKFNLSQWELWQYHGADMWVGPRQYKKRHITGKIGGRGGGLSCQHWDSLPFRTAVRNILQHGRQQSANYAKRQQKQAIKPDWLFLRLWDLRACD